MREKATEKERAGKNVLGAKQLENDADMTANQNDVYINKESGKMVVNDFEQDGLDKEAKKVLRKKEGYGVDSDTDSDDEVT